MYPRSDMTAQTGTTYKSNIDACLASLAGAVGKRRNTNGDMRVNQLSPSVALSGSWQYVTDMWEVQSYTPANSSGTFSDAATGNFPGGFGLGCTSLTTSTGSVVIAFRTKMEADRILDLLTSPAYEYPITGTPQHPFACAGLLAFQNSGQALPCQLVLRSANSLNSFGTMSNSLTSPQINLASGVVSLLPFDTAANAFQLDTLTNAGNGLCLEIQFTLPTGLTGITLQIADVQFEGGQVATFFGRKPIADELFDSKRYLHAINPGNGVTIGVGAAETTTSLLVPIHLSNPLWTPATGVTISSASHFNVLDRNSAIAVTSIALNDASADGTRATLAVTTTTAMSGAGDSATLKSVNAAAQLFFTGTRL